MKIALQTHNTAPTEFVKANGIRFAYRRFGRTTGVPLLFMQHFRGAWTTGTLPSPTDSRQIGL